MYKIITPKTKIYDLLQEYPELEDMLIEMAPQFEKLRNPVLRKTITRITSLNQAATIAGMDVEDMINRLRKAVGQEPGEEYEGTGGSYNTEKQKWVKKKKLAATIDIRDMLHKGEQPVHEVLSSIKRLGDKEKLMVIAPFIPAPLIDKATGMDYKHWLHKESEDEYHVYFSR
ncbi:MAG: DUF1858 domain-containing protein [Bacteroidales bacterium]|nr:DUF1858 domain-containing protein [Bacteroidales bacterium]